MKTADGAPIELIENSGAFAALQRELEPHPYLALDTEFVRTNTFYPLLGLIQIGDKERCFLVDPLPFPDKAPLSEFLGQSDRTFVLHSCSEDLNLLLTTLSVTPSRVFDTQIAAAFLGLGFSLSYQALVHDMLGIDIPKDETRSDWIKRPLSEPQKIYAATDVRYLLELREMLEFQLKNKQIYEWFDEDCRDLLAVAPVSEVSENWQQAYQNINNAWRLNDQGLNYLQSLCVWREEEARSRNKPRSWIAKDNDLLAIASRMSIESKLSLDALLSITAVEKQLLNRYSNKLMDLLLSAQGSPAKIERELLNNPLSPNSRKKLKACQKVVLEIAGDLNIAPELLGRKRIILELVRGSELNGNESWPTGVSGWRRRILEPALADILSN